MRVNHSWFAVDLPTIFIVTGVKYMSIYIINPSFIMKNHSKAHCFVKELKEQFDKYDISYSMVNNAAKYLSKIENNNF